VRRQLRELCTNYGRIDLLFYDGGLPDDFKGEAAKPITAMVRKLQPHIVVNNRDRNANDYDTPENYIAASAAAGRGVQHDHRPAMVGLSRHGRPAQERGPVVLVPAKTRPAGGGNLMINVGRARRRRDSRDVRQADRGRRAVAAGQRRGDLRQPRGFNVLCTCGRATVVGENLYHSCLRHEAPTCVSAAS